MSIYILISLFAIYSSKSDTNSSEYSFLLSPFLHDRLAAQPGKWLLELRERVRRRIRSSGMQHRHNSDSHLLVGERSFPGMSSSTLQKIFNLCLIIVFYFRNYSFQIYIANFQILPYIQRAQPSKYDIGKLCVYIYIFI